MIHCDGCKVRLTHTAYPNSGLRCDCGCRKTAISIYLPLKPGHYYGGLFCDMKCSVNNPKFKEQ
jgi:hypothetical protein